MAENARAIGVVVCMSLFVFAIVARAVAQTGEQPPRRDIFAKDNLVAWCIVPFDAKQRGPAERAEMLVRLGFKKVAYDWRANHVPTFEQEILEYKKHGLEYFAFWSEHERAFELFEKYKLHPQIWKTNPSPPGATQDEKVQTAAAQLLPLVERTRQMGCRLGLYNHGGWGGEPQNLVAVCEWLQKHQRAEHVGIVYNFHHGHDHIADFAESLKRMQPHLLCLNINGMNDGAKPMILPIGQGRHEKQMLQIVLDSGYDGPIGILDHRPELDAEECLQANLRGLEKLRKELVVSRPEASH